MNVVSNSSVAMTGPAVSNVNGSSIAAAAADGTLGFGFSGSGFLLFYFVGVSSVLRNLGVINSSTTFAGASGGSINSAVACAGVDASQQFDAARTTARSCRPSNGCRGFLDAALHKQLQTILPNDAAQRCSGRLFVVVTEAQPRRQPDTPLLLGSNWTDNQQLVLALRASSYIPVQSGRAATLKLPWLPGNVAAYDGGFTVGIPCPPGVSYCVKVSSHTQGAPASATATPGAQQATNSTAGRNSGTAPRSGRRSAGAPAALQDGGQAPAPAAGGGSAPGAAAAPAASMGGFSLDAALVLLNNLLNITSRNDTGTGPFLPLNPVPAKSNTTFPDIYPGLSGPLLVPARTWNSYSLSIPADATLKYLYDVGRMDAAYWAVANGLASPAQAIEALSDTVIAS